MNSILDAVEEYSDRNVTSMGSVAGMLELAALWPELMRDFIEPKKASASNAAKPEEPAEEEEAAVSPESPDANGGPSAELPAPTPRSAKVVPPAPPIANNGPNPGPAAQAQGGGQPGVTHVTNNYITNYDNSDHSDHSVTNTVSGSYNRRASSSDSDIGYEFPAGRRFSGFDAHGSRFGDVGEGHGVADQNREEDDDVDSVNGSEVDSINFEKNDAERLPNHSVEEGIFQIELENEEDRSEKDFGSIDGGGDSLPVNSPSDESAVPRSVSHDPGSAGSGDLTLHSDGIPVRTLQVSGNAKADERDANLIDSEAGFAQSPLREDEGHDEVDSLPKKEGAGNAGRFGSALDSGPSFTDRVRFDARSNSIVIPVRHPSVSASPDVDDSMSNSVAEFDRKRQMFEDRIADNNGKGSSIQLAAPKQFTMPEDQVPAMKSVEIARREIEAGINERASLRLLNERSVREREGRKAGSSSPLNLTWGRNLEHLRTGRPPQYDFDLSRFDRANGGDNSISLLPGRAESPLQ